MPRGTSLTMRSWVLVVALGSLPGCGGGDNGPTPTPTPTPTPRPVPQVVDEGSESGIGVLTLLYVPFSSSLSGPMDITVDWTSASNDVDIYLTQGTDACELDTINADQCPFVAMSESGTAKPERISLPNAAAGDYTLYIGNRGPTDESVSWQVVVTSSAVAASGRTPTVAAPRQKDAFLQAVRRP